MSDEWAKAQAGIQLGMQGEIDALKADLAAASVEIEEHRGRFERVIVSIGEHMGKAKRFERERDAARADAERLRGAMQEIRSYVTLSSMMSSAASIWLSDVVDAALAVTPATGQAARPDTTESVEFGWTPEKFKVRKAVKDFGDSVGDTP